MTLSLDFALQKDIKISLCDGKSFQDECRIGGGEPPDRVALVAVIFRFVPLT
jgi:hypothetical protein